MNHQAMPCTTTIADMAVLCGRGPAHALVVTHGIYLDVHGGISKALSKTWSEMSIAPIEANELTSSLAAVWKILIINQATRTSQLLIS